MAKDKICRPFVGIIAPENKFTVDTIDDLKSRNYLTIGDIVDLNGYYTAGDGAHHKRKIESADDGSGVQLANRLWANIVHNGEVNVSWFGAKGDGVTDDSYAIGKAISKAKIIKIPSKTYSISETLELNNKHIIGENRHFSKIIMDTQEKLKPIIVVGRTSKLKEVYVGFSKKIQEEMENTKPLQKERVAVLCGNKNTYSFQVGGTIENCILEGVGTGISDNVKGCFSVEFRNIEIKKYARTGIDITNGSTGNVFDNLYLSNIGSTYRPTHVINFENQGNVNISLINIEHTICNTPFRAFNSEIIAQTLHFEGVDVISAYNSYLKLEKTNAKIDNLEFYWTGMLNDGTKLIILGDTGIDGVGEYKSTVDNFLNIGTLYCRGLNRPDESSMPDYPIEKRSLNNATAFGMIYRNSGFSNWWFVNIENYKWFTPIGVEDDSQHYIDFPKSDGDYTKIKYLKIGLSVTSKISQLNTPYHVTKMKQEGVYEDFIQYMDSKTEYDRLQREAEQQRQLAFEQRENQEQTYDEWLSEQPMIFPVVEEPQPSEALLKFKEKYLG